MLRVEVEDTINSYKKLYCKQMISSARALRNKSYVIQRAAPCMIGPIMHGAALSGFIRYLESHGKSWNLVSVPGIF